MQQVWWEIWFEWNAIWQHAKIEVNEVSLQLIAVIYEKVVHLVLQQRFCMYVRVVNEPTNSDPNPARKYQPEPKNYFEVQIMPKENRKFSSV